MLKALAAAMLLVLAGGAAPPGGSAPARPPAPYSQLIVREQIVVRLPPGFRDGGGPPDAEWKEKKGPKCIPAHQVIGAALVSQNSVDLILRDRSRLRARLDSSCPALDYYYGFYISPNADGMICADRDVIRSRMGGHCGIDRFKILQLRHRD